MSEHGEQAAIAAVNRIRSGGVAGFFCREEFEVIVDPNGDSSTAAESEPESEMGAEGESESERGVERWPASDDAEPSEDETIAQVIGRTTEDRPPSRLAAIAAATDEGDPAPARPTPPTQIDDEPVTGSGVEPAVFGGPVAPGDDPARDRFLALLERRLDETSDAEDEVLRRRSRPAPDHTPEQRRSAGPVAPAPAAPAPRAASTPLAGAAPMTDAVTTPPSPLDPADHQVTPTLGTVPSLGARSRGPRPVFWQRLDRVTDELASFLPSGSTRTAVVGPLPLVSAIVTRLQSTQDLASADVVVLTDRAGIVSEPTWRLERNGDRLLRAVEEADGRPLIVVIDVPGDLPSWVGSLQRRLRTAGIELFRYAIPGQPASADLERYRQGADVPYAIDLTSRVEPGLVVGLIADRHPIVSVAGADLGPELLLALRRHVGAIEPSAEPVIDG